MLRRRPWLRWLFGRRLLGRQLQERGLLGRGLLGRGLLRQGLLRRVLLGLLGQRLLVRRLQGRRRRDRKLNKKLCNDPIGQALSGRPDPAPVAHSAAAGARHCPIQFACERLPRRRPLAFLREEPDGNLDWRARLGPAGAAVDTCAEVCATCPTKEATATGRAHKQHRSI